MSPFKSTKLGFLSNSVQYILQRDNEVGAAVTHTGQHEWSYGDYNYIAFTGPGIFEVQRSGYMDFCLVGGGGGGANGCIQSSPPYSYQTGGGGGGGAGGVHHIYDHKAQIGTYTVTIGAGGATGSVGGGTPKNTPIWGFAGTATKIESPHINPANYEFYAAGGGGGIGADSSSPYNTGGPVQSYGASGGGKTGNAGTATATYANFVSSTTTPLAPFQPNGVVQGYNGASGANNQSGGGGGGAGGAGLTGAPSNYGGQGGPGVRIFAGDTGVNPPATPANLDLGEASPANVSPGRYVGGGGMGGSGTSPQTTQDSGGLGGGGSQNNYGGGYPGTTNTGGGGAGGAEPGSNPGGSGGPGLVVVRYLRIVDAG
tara:strand:+ start:4523 stop:5632 length:1110 start_codon:yes stop_codon:yes gene_type:complete